MTLIQKLSKDPLLSRFPKGKTPHTTLPSYIRRGRSSGVVSLLETSKKRGLKNGL
jgi:hypothetical protein